MNTKDEEKAITTAEVDKSAESGAASAPANVQQDAVKPTASALPRSNAVKSAQAALAALTKPASYTSRWQSQIDSALSKILNREEFSYDVNADKLYDQYKKQYVSSGKKAMEDTVGQMSTMTGGYGNSWAQTAGQAAYGEEMAKLNDVIPELYQLALERYNSEGDALRQNYGLLLDAESTDYGRYRDTVSDYLTERDYRRGVYDDERNFDYQKQLDDRELALTLDRYKKEDAQYAQQVEYQKERDAVEDARYAQAWEKDVADSDWEKTFAEDERTYSRQMDAMDYALKAASASSGGGQPRTSVPTEVVKTEYSPYGNMTEKEFYSEIADAFSDYKGGENPSAITSAVAAVKRAGTTDEAVAAFGDYFGEDAVRQYFPTADEARFAAAEARIAAAEGQLLTKAQFMRTGGRENGATYEDYVYDTVISMIEQGALTREEAEELIARSER